MNAADREVLRDAAAHAGLASFEVDRFCSEVERRLEKGEAEYRDHPYTLRSFPECEEEAIEEQADAGGWTSLALRLLAQDVEDGFPADEAELVRLHALQGVAQAQQAAISFREAVRHYREYEHEIQRSEPDEPPISCQDERLSLTSD